MEWIDIEGANHMGRFETSKENGIYIENEIKARKQFLRFTIVSIGHLLALFSVPNRPFDFAGNVS